jgi:hypothetical protein
MGNQCSKFWCPLDVLRDKTRTSWSIETFAEPDVDVSKVWWLLGGYIVGDDHSNLQEVLWKRIILLRHS